MPGRRWTREEVETLKRLAAIGTRASVIAMALNRTAEAVYARVQHEGIRIRSRRDVMESKTARKTRTQCAARPREISKVDLRTAKKVYRAETDRSDPASTSQQEAIEQR